MQCPRLHNQKNHLGVTDGPLVRLRLFPVKVVSVGGGDGGTHLFLVIQLCLVFVILL